ncbi:ATP-binding protein [Alkalicoccus daliensis]|uniref:histidine kinase n=1 Tax=Alkalicoccus daliensis TaxID=745820 RepID=A0A1H0K6I3_9BACI|nr:ATP-binding protein [Alkalicoccus daliensis]SDO51494.1 HAMP domain-containing protein [Alkalicoccus daliensis]
MKEGQKKKGSIRRDFIRRTILFISVIAAVALAVTIYIFIDQQQKMEEQENLSAQLEATNDVSDELNRLFYHSRAYFAYRQENDLASIDNVIERIEVAISNYRDRELEESEFMFIEELESFLIRYQSTILPTALSFVEENDYEGLQNYGVQGSTAQIDYLLNQADTLSDQAFEELQDGYAEAMTESNRNILLAMLLGALGFTAMIIGSLRMLNKLVEPIEELTLASDDLAEGKEMRLEGSNRNDEIGVLNLAFKNMVNTMQRNEEELTAQNEELHAQQEMLEDSLDEIQKEKMKIDRYSELNQTMSTKLEKEEFLTSIFQYINELYPSDKSILYMLEDEEYRAVGMTEENIQNWKNADKTEWIQRLRESSHVLIQRPGTQSERGVADEEVMVYDYYTSIKDTNDKIFAIFTSVKIGESYTEEEMEEIEAVMSHVGLGLERSVIYEEIARSRKLSQDILDNVNEAIQFVSAKGTTVQMNRSMSRFLQKTGDLERSEWEQSLLDKVEDPESLQDFFNEFLNNHYEGTKSRQFEMTEENIRKVIIAYGTTVYDEEEKLGTVFVYRDMTREYELDQMKSELVSTVSHELRTPLSSVLGFTELLLTKELKPERQKRYLSTIHKEAKRLTNLINDFLDLQRMEAGSQPYHMENTSLDELAMEIIYQFKNEKHEFSFIDETSSALVKADRERLQQVLTNLVSNAVKFSPEGGEITLHLRNEGEDIVVAIEDEGLGIPEASISTLFNKFQRIDQGDRKNIGGTGLGLAICREIIERHGGRIWVESVEEKGSTFSFRLPMQPHDDARPRVTLPEGHPDGASAVIVEDDASLALLLSEELKSHGFKVIHHLNPDHAYKDILRQQPSAVVVDLMLGDTVDGWDLVQRLKENAETQDIPIVISSALDRSDEKMRQYGIEKYLTKPYPPQDLSRTLLNFIQEYRSHKGDILFPAEEEI